MASANDAFNGFDGSWDDDVHEHTRPDARPELLDDDQVETLLFTATNPPGTVSASAVMDGRIVRVELSATVVQMTEIQLAEEITVISTLARRQAQAAQHALAARVLHELGHDGAATRSYLERELGLPSPRTARAEKVELFSKRYTDEDA